MSYKVQKDEIKSITFYNSEKRLVHFYSWLSINKLIKEEVKIHPTGPYNQFGTANFISQFKRLNLGVPYPKKKNTPPNRLHDFGHDRREYIGLFLKFIEIYSPEILLGVMLQFYGGLRAGEVVSLKICNILFNDKLSKQPITIEIKDNIRKRLFLWLLMGIKVYRLVIIQKNGKKLFKRQVQDSCI